MARARPACSHCGHPLIAAPIGDYYRLMCDNAEERCPLFRECQGNIPKNDKARETARGLAAGRRYLVGNPSRKMVKV